MSEGEARSKSEVLASLVLGEIYEAIQKAEAMNAKASEIEGRIGESAERLSMTAEKLRGDFKTYVEGEAKRTKAEIKDAAIESIREHLADEVNRAVVVALTSSKKQLAVFIAVVAVVSSMVSSAFTMWLLK